MLIRKPGLIRSGMLLLLAGTLSLTLPSALGAAAPPASAAAASTTMTDDIYTLQHKVIPGILFSDKGTMLFEDLFSGRTEVFHSMVKGALGEAYDSGMKFKPEHHPDYDIVLISFPPPFAEPACFHSALVKSGNTFRYITLEAGNDIGGTRTASFLCEWTPESAHRNYGPRSYKELDAFRSELLTFLKNPAAKK
jgi:hypothetical protein